MAARSRAYRREQMVRMAKKRVRQWREARPDEAHDELFAEWRPTSIGHFTDEQPYLGCRRAHCGMCHGDKHHPGQRRQQEKTVWQKIIQSAYGH